MTNGAAWMDFIVCFFFGWLGVHKFREKRTGMGILYLCTGGIFGIGWCYDIVRYFVAAIKGKRIQGNGHAMQRHLKPDMPLPEVSSPNMFLSDGEICHYCGQATLVKTKNVVVGYTGGSAGATIRIAKGVSFRTGSSKGMPVRGDVQEKTNGVLSISNKRVVFSSIKTSFDKKISSLSALTPYQDGIVFQFGSQQYPMESNEPQYIYEIITRIVNPPEYV